MKQVKLYTPHANQRIIHQHPARNRVVVAGRRFGKSALGLNEAIARASLLKNQIVWVILPLYRQAKEIYWIDPDITRYFMPYVNSGAVKADKSELSLHFKKNNSWVRLKGSDNYDSLRGSGIDLIVWDEVADVKQEAFDTVEPALADSPNHRQLFIGTPKGLNWFHDFALKGDHDNKVPDFGKAIKTSRDWMSWHFTSYDNLTWAEGSKERKSFVDYINEKKEEAREKGRLAFWEQEYMASFSESAGRFFPQWSYKKHMYDGRLEALPEYDIYESIDWGRTAPFAWYAHMIVPVEWIDPETLDKYEFTRIYTFAELYGTKLSPKEWSYEILKKRYEFGIEETKMIICDPSMFNPLSDGSTPISQQMRQGFDEKGNYSNRFEAGTKNRLSRWSAMDDWMRTAIDSLPYWIITKDCRNLARTIPLMEPDENKPEDLNTDLEDHAVDSVSYFIPFIKWIDSKAGSVKRKRPQSLPPRFQHLVKLDKFRK